MTHATPAKADWPLLAQAVLGKVQVMGLEDVVAGTTGSYASARVHYINAAGNACSHRILAGDQPRGNSESTNTKDGRSWWPYARDGRRHGVTIADVRAARKAALRALKELPALLMEYTMVINGLPPPTVVEDEDDAEDTGRRCDVMQDASRFLSDTASCIHRDYLDSEGRLEGSIYDPCFFLPAGQFNFLHALADVFEASGDALAAAAHRDHLRAGGD